jgi:hypothetical protein
MAKSEVSAVTWAQSENRDEKVLSGLRAQVQMDLLFQLIQLKREAQALKIIALENSPEAQVGAITFLDSESLQVKTNWQWLKVEGECVIKINI